MLTEFLRSARDTSSHWAIVVGVAVIFLVIQVVLSVRLSLRTRRQDRMLRRLTRELQRGGSGLRDPDDLPARFDWLQWVLTVFPSAPDAPPASFAREEVFHELDTRVASDGSYLLLQRMGVMAPLLGVVLTVIGFFWLDVDSTAQQSLQTILGAVTPLVSGVGAGAVLALINQGLLQTVGGRMERLRMTARTWFDEAIWSRASAKAQRPASEAAATIERFSQSVAQSAKRHALSSEHIEVATKALQSAASQFQDVVLSFRNEIKGIPQALCDLRDATAASAAMLQEMLPAGQRAVANLDVSVSAFRTIIDREFGDAAKLHFRSSKMLSDSVGHLHDSTDQLKTRVAEMAQGAEVHAASLERIDETLTTAAKELAGASGRLRSAIESDFGPSQHAISRTSTSFAQTAERLNAFVDEGLQPAARELGALHHTLSGLKQTVASIHDFSESRADIDQLLEALSRASEVADAIAALPEQIREVVEQSGLPPRERENAGRKVWLRARPR
jgi:methyl-accepting chemotaxis protein